MKDQDLLGIPVSSGKCCSETAAAETACCDMPAPVDQDCCSTGAGGPSVGLNSLLGGSGVNGSLVSRRKAGFDQLRSAWLLVVLIPLLVWILDPERLAEVLDIASTALAGTAPFVVIAVLLIGYLKAVGAEGLIAKAFEGRDNHMIVLAALVGGLAPFCSCQVIPFVAGLLAVGVPVAPVMAFWLSSPLIDPGSLLVTAGALGWTFAIGKAFAAVFLGLFGGFGVKFLLRSGAFANPLRGAASSGCASGACSASGIAAEQPRWLFWKENSRIKVFRAAALENALFLFKWLTLAYLLEALLILYVPAELIGGIVGGDGLWPIVLGALVGMPAYLNSYAAPPLVAGLMEQGMSLGAAMAFMVAGAISSIPAMTAVWSLVKRPVFVAYLGFGVSGAVLFAFVFAAIAPALGGA